MKKVSIQGKIHWLLNEEEYSVLVNLAASAGNLYSQVDEDKLPWPAFEGRVLPTMVEKFIETHDLEYANYHEDLQRFVEDTFAPVLPEKR